ncbi:hypothetical protein LOD99_9285 [Oopsacas minuta]|uniref:Uncharacterized protein n=1 Tax=Oopsacas minuta TaxID=111878 RepID=A0AAV7JC45_9METZ|nr:hypothetical protein LOD99_9285 [Oopsacas minuta]
MGQANTNLSSIGKELDQALKTGEAQFSQMTTPSNPLEVFQSGRRVALLSKTSGKYLRCLPDGNLDSLGILDAYSNFFVNSIAPNRFTIRNCGYNTQFISLAGGLLTCRGTGGPDCEFSASITTDKYIILESISNPGHNIGTLNTGAITNPAQTLKEHLAAHFKPMQTNTADTALKEVSSSLQKGVNEVVTSGNQFEALQNGNVVLLESKLSKKCLHIRADNIIDTLGLAEPSSEFLVYVTQSPTEQLYSFSMKQNPAVHLAIQEGILMGASGPLDTCSQFRAHIVPPNFMAFESIEKPGVFIGSLPDGSISDPTKTSSADEASSFIVRHQKLYL